MMDENDSYLNTFILYSLQANRIPPTKAPADKTAVRATFHVLIVHGFSTEEDGS